MTKPEQNNGFIKWQDVIEIDPAMKNEVKAELTAALEKIQSYGSGQRLFTKLSSVQKLIPADSDYAGTIENGIESENVVYKQILSRRVDTQKVFINVVGAAPDSRMPEADSLLDGHKGAGYYPIVHTIRLDLDKLRTSGIPLQDASGRRFLAPTSLDETLFHELQHVVDFQGTRRDNGFLRFRVVRNWPSKQKMNIGLRKIQKRP